MNLASYSRMDDEVNTVRLIIDGLGEYSHFKNAARSLRLAILPGTINILQDRLLDEEAAKLSAPQF